VSVAKGPSFTAAEREIDQGWAAIIRNDSEVLSEVFFMDVNGVGWFVAGPAPVFVTTAMGRVVFAE